MLYIFLNGGATKIRTLVEISPPISLAKTPLEPLEYCSNVFNYKPYGL